MSLNWSTAQVANNNAVCFRVAEADDPGMGIKKGDHVLRPVTQALIWATMAVGIGRITAANAEEFFCRATLHEALNGAMRYSPEREPIHFTLAEVRDHVGLSTNVSNESTTAWRKRVLDRFDRDTLRKAKARATILELTSGQPGPDKEST